SFVAQSKRAIDTFNQQRHEQIEQLDTWLFALLYEHNARPLADTELHSETPGNLLDRLSILTLKVYYMGREAERQDATVGHRQICDVLLSTPVLRALRCYYPQSYIAFLTEPSPGRVLQGNPLLDEVIIRPRHSTWRQQWQLIRHIRRQCFELVIDLIGNPRSAVLTRLSGARHRLAFARFPRSFFYTMLVTHHQPVQEYTVAKRLRLLAPLGI